MNCHFWCKENRKNDIHLNSLIGSAFALVESSVQSFFENGDTATADAERYRSKSIFYGLNWKKLAWLTAGFNKMVLHATLYVTKF